VAGEVINGYKELAESGCIELSVTPFNHPILPLLLDLAVLGQHDREDPLPDFGFPSDALEQIRKAQTQFEHSFGFSPRGMWPAEGSVSDAALACFADAGVQWVATDQANLPAEAGGRLEHLKPWRWKQAERELSVFFRDTRIADNIGFEYYRWNAEHAAQHMIHNLIQLGEQSRVPAPVVTVALDGENPWENYPDGGRGFLTALFRAIEAESQVACRLPSELMTDVAAEALDTIHPGSWIGGNFDIWSRHAETKQAWRTLAKARKDLDSYVTSEAVYSSLLAAEASDWFWWYGDDFISAQQGIFDDLFRSHLQAAYASAGVEVPHELSLPIKADFYSLPLVSTSLIEPSLDGKVTSFFEWRGALQVTKGLGQGSMARAIPVQIERVLLGFSRDAMWIRIDISAGFKSELANSVSVLRLTLASSAGLEQFEVELSEAVASSSSFSAAFAEIVEARVALDASSVLRGQSIRLSLEILGGELAARFPAHGDICLRVPTLREIDSLWTV
jgi:alpha-amylase/alpha-mannosidase (GH57 family)